MSGIGNNNQYSNVRAINRSDGSAFLLSDRLASLNFNGFIPRTNAGIYASDLKVGQTIFSSDPTAQNNTFFITRIDSSPVTVEDVSENSYFLYFLGDSNIEEAYTYGAENENGSFSQNHLFNSYRDDTSGLSIGTDGWMITNQGNAVFSNVFVRGTVEATSGKIDGILSIGEDLSGTPLVTIGKNLFESAPFEGSSSEHSGIFLNKDNYFMGYEDLQTVPILSVVAEDSTRNVTLRKAVFTLANHTLSVRDEVSIFGFTEDKFLELDNVFQVEEVTQNTFTVYYKNEIPGTTSPISVNLKVESFALDNIYTVTELNLVNVVSTENTSALKIYIDKQYTGNFEQDFTINIGSATNEIFLQNTRHLVESIVETAGPDDPDYLTATCLRVPSGTYTTGLGQINSFLTNHKFKVGNETNSMSYNSFTGALTVTGKINADSGNFTNTVTIGKNNTSYSVYNKKLLGGVATLTTETIHNFVIGDTVIVSGVDNTFNGTYVVTGVPTVESFTYDKVSDPVASTPVSPLGTAAIGEAENGTLSVGYGTNKITIDGTGTASTSAIYAGVGNYGNADTGFFMDASGRFSLKDKLTFSGNLSIPVLAVKGEITADTLDVGGEEGITYDGETVRIGTDVTIIGGVTATSFGIDANNYWNTSGNEGDFRVGNASTYMFWNKTGTDTGTLQVRGEINATSGTIEGDFEINGDAQINGSIFVGGSPTTGQRVAITDSGIIGVDNSNITVFNLPATGTTPPTMTNFNILEAKITGAGSNAYLIAGTTGVDATNIVVRGDKSVPGQAAAIYSTISGTATDATTGNGFYLDDTGKFRFAQGSNVISGSGGNLSVTGAITATSGTIGGFTIGSSSLYGGSGSNFVGIIPASLPFFAGATANNGTGAVFKVTNAGALTATNANITGTITGSTINGGTIAIGSGNSIFKADTNGIYLGNALFTSAPFRVTAAGALTATSGSIGGWSISTTGLTTESSNIGFKTNSAGRSISKTGSATALSTTITLNNTTGLSAGMVVSVSGTAGLTYTPAATVIVTVVNSTQITVSKPTFIAISNLPITFWYPYIWSGGLVGTSTSTGMAGFQVFGNGTIMVNDIAVQPGSLDVAFNSGISTNTGTGSDIGITLIKRPYTTTSTNNFYLACYNGTSYIGGILDGAGNGVLTYATFLGTHYSEISPYYDYSSIPLGTVLESVDDLVEIKFTQQERLPKAKISDTYGSKKVYGVFMGIDDSQDENRDYLPDGIHVASVGAGWVRISESAIVFNGDLLISNGDGTAVAQEDDLIRSSTIGKVTSGTKTKIYEDGSYLVPAVLYCG